MQDLTIKSYNVNMTNKYKVNTVQTYNKVNFTGLLDVFFRDDTQPKFIPTCKISENETKYVGELCTYLAKSRLSPGELQSAYRRIYSTLKTPDEKKLFRDYFGKYLPPVPRKTEQQSVEQPKPPKPAAPAAPVPVKSPETNGSSKKIPANNTAKSLLKEFDSIEKENIPAFVSKAAKGSREEQYQLLDLYINKSKEHKQLPANSTERLALGTKLATLRKQMEEKNISFVPKAPEKFDTEEQDRRTAKMFGYDYDKVVKRYPLQSIDDIRIMSNQEKQRYAVIMDNGINSYEGLQNRQDSCIKINVLFDLNMWCEANKNVFVRIEELKKLGFLDVFEIPHLEILNDERKLKEIQKILSKKL